MIISSILKSDADDALVAVGIDAEKIYRFIPYIEGKKEALKLVFSEEELASCIRSENPAMSMCASFTFKEALYKIIGPYSFTDCVLNVDLNNTEQGSFYIPKKLFEEKEIQSVTVHVSHPCDDEVLTVLYAWRKNGI